MQKCRVVWLPVDLEALCRTARGEEKLRAKDVSPGGVILSAAGEFQVGEELELEFAEKPWSDVEPVKGAVMWAREHAGTWACGVTFRGLSRQQERLLVHLVAQELARQSAREAQQVKS